MKLSSRNVVKLKYSKNLDDERFFDIFDIPYQPSRLRMHTV
jgi:hypothetical protein